MKSQIKTWQRVKVSEGRFCLTPEQHSRAKQINSEKGKKKKMDMPASPWWNDLPLQVNL